MPIINVRDNENNRLKRNTKKEKKESKRKTNKDIKEQGRTEAIMKGWELNNFPVHLS